MKKLQILFITVAVAFTGYCASDENSNGGSETDPDTQAVNTAADNLTTSSLTFTGNDSSDSITGNITLPSSGSEGTTITWSSDNSSVISNDGTVTRPEYDAGDATVTLTATVTKNGKTATKTITVTVKNETGWPLDAYAKASNASGADEFGHSVAADGDYMIVGAPFEDKDQQGITNNDSTADPSTGTSTNPQGAAYVFKRGTNGDWVQDAYLKPSNSDTYQRFGISVDISGDYIVVGASYEKSNSTTIVNADGNDSSNTDLTGAGAVYIFKKDSSGNWVQDAYIKPDTIGIWYEFGQSVSLENNTLAVGTPRYSAGDKGIVYIFTRDSSTGHWSQTESLQASNAINYDNFGYSLSLSGNYLAVGAKGEKSNAQAIDNNDDSASSDNSAVRAGAVYIFKKNTTTGNWSQDAYLKASNAEAEDQFGYSVSLDGNYVAVGAFYEESSQTTITNTDGSASTDNSAVRAGAVYIFKRDSSSGDWSQDAYLKASNAEGVNASDGDSFGRSVSLQGSFLAVGADEEDSSQTTITHTDGSASSDNAAAKSGAVYLFELSSSDNNWRQVSYNKAANAGANDLFGSAVFMTDDFVFVGARDEDSNHTAVTNTDGSASSDNSETDAGAVYIFKKD